MDLNSRQRRRIEFDALAFGKLSTQSENSHFKTFLAHRFRQNKLVLAYVGFNQVFKNAS